MSDTTPLATRANILADFWEEYKTDPKFADFMSYNDLGLPLAYAVSSDIIRSNVLVDNFIGETFDMLLSILGIEDEGFESLTDIFFAAGGGGE